MLKLTLDQISWYVNLFSVELSKKSPREWFCWVWLMKSAQIGFISILALALQDF